MPRSRIVLAVVFAAVSLLTPSCRNADTTATSAHPWLVIGIDGADWEVIRELWALGELPTLRDLADRGSTATLRTAYDASPIIWTTIATGKRAEEHGITDFVVATPAGDRPVNSHTRQVPALWNMLSESGVRSAWLGWWATWPAEEIEGVIVSDRVLEESEAPASPASFRAQLSELADAAQVVGPKDHGLPNEGVGARDRFMVHTGVTLLESHDFELVAVYIRSLDIQSHFFWKYHLPERFDVPEAERLRIGDPVAEVYRQVDAAIAQLIEAAGDANVLVISDHGFHALERERVVVELDFDRVLAALGFLQLLPAGSGIDLERSRVFGFATRPTEPLRKLRFGPEITNDEQRAATRQQLQRALDRVTWLSGETAFELRTPDARQRREGAELIARVRRGWADGGLLLDGTPLEIEVEITRISGSHGRNTHGILIAAGPDVAQRADLEGIRIHDIAPTLLQALGLPVAEDFAGVPRTELLARPRPLASIPSWGTRSPAAQPQPTAQSDQEELRQLRALGYIE